MMQHFPIHCVHTAGMVGDRLCVRPYVCVSYCRTGLEKIELPWQQYGGTIAARNKVSTYHVI